MSIVSLLDVFLNVFSNRFAATAKDGRKYVIKVTNFIYEMYEIVCRNKRKPEYQFPKLVLRINARKYVSMIFFPVM